MQSAHERNKQIIILDYKEEETKQNKRQQTIAITTEHVSFVKEKEQTNNRACIISCSSRLFHTPI